MTSVPPDQLEDPAAPPAVAARRWPRWVLAGLLVAAIGGVLAWQLWPEPETRRSDFDASSITLAQWCAPDADGHYPEGIGEIDRGESPDYAWAEGGGCVHRSLSDAMQVLDDIPYLVGYDAGRIDRYEVEVIEPDDERTLKHYEILYEVDELVTVAWTMSWTHELVEGTPEAPEQVLVRYRRIDGSRFMPYWEGSMVLERVTDDVTAVFIHDEIKTIRSDADSSALAVERFFDKFVKGSPRKTARR